MNNTKSNYSVYGNVNNTVKQLTGEMPFLSEIARKGVQKINDDYNEKYSKVGFPDNYYVEFGTFLVNCAIDKYKDIGIALNAVTLLIDSEEGFDNGKGAPLFHVYENVVRKNDDTGLDKLLHFMYSAKISYQEYPVESFVLGLCKELFLDEFNRLLDDNEKGWDNKDMKANIRGILYSHDLYYKRLRQMKLNIDNKIDEIINKIK